MTAWAVVAAGLLLVARKPWALTHPQLWAEDGSVFLLQHDALGARALLTPYEGYLHFLPRVIAWLTSLVADVAAWPLLYNGGALLVTVLLLARFASTRLEVPGKPWLVLALVLAAHTGEVLLTITNLQWLAAFFLVQQALIARPVTTTQRLTDLAITIAVGLTGPFGLLLLPLFVWRWARDRHRDNLVLLGAIVACAAVQAYFILAMPPHAETPPVRPLMLGAVLASRLIAWPLLGPKITEALPLAALAVIGVVGFGALATWALRADPRRELRAKILVALVVFAAAGAWRCRPDTWETANLANGDRYFFIPRVLLAWLVIWEFDARPRFVAWIARGLGILAIAWELPQHRLPAPIDYQWAKHCDAIRLGVPATIPTLPEGWFFNYPGKPARMLPIAKAASLGPAYPAIAGEARDRFSPGGDFPGSPLRTAGPVRTWCSWDRSGQATGSLAFGPFPAPPRLIFAVGGYPRETGNHLFIELVASRERIDARPDNPGEHWQLLDLPLPETWRGQPIRLIAVEGTTTPTGWLAISEPLQK
jgi:hypothetical protein